MIITDEASSYTTDGKRYKPGDTCMVDLPSFCPDFMVKVEEGKPAKKVTQSQSVMDQKVEKAEAFAAEKAKEEDTAEEGVLLTATSDEPVEVKEESPKPAPRRRKK